MNWTCIESPIGELLLVGDRDALTEVRFPPARGAHDPGDAWTAGATPLLRRAARQLGEYFSGQRQAFDLPLAPRGTDFQLLVWRELERIPFGRTISYGELARRIGRPSASRAVGAANGRNPLPIVVPCHRVIGADGSLTGFGGGLPAKRALLALEGVGEATLFGAGG